MFGRTGTQISTTGATGASLLPGAPGAAHGTQTHRQLYRLIFDPTTSLILDSENTIPGGGSRGTILLAFFDQGIVGSLPAGGDTSPR